MKPSYFACILAVALVHPAWSEQIDSSYSAAMMDLTCKSDLVFYPNSTEQVAAHISIQVKAAAAAGTGLKVRASHRSFHSTAPFTCPGQAIRSYPGRDNKPVPVLQTAAGSPPAAISPVSNVTTVTLLLDSMNQVLSVNAEQHQMRVQAGMFVTQLLHEAANRGMSVPLGSVPAFGDLSLGGVLVTGAHGTGHLTTSSLADILVEITWVDGLGNVHTSPRDSDAGKALVSGLGVAGLVTELLLQLQPSSSTAVETRIRKGDRQLFSDVLGMLQESPHVLIVWRPDLKMYTAHLLSQANASARITGTMNQAEVPKPVVQGLGKALELWQADVHDLVPALAAPVMTAVLEASVSHTYATHPWGGPMLKGIGDTNKMQAMSCGKKCLWNLGSKIAMDDIHFSIELEQLKPWIDDVKKIMAADLWHHGLKRLRFMSPGYFWLRFGHGSNDFLSHTSGLKAPVHVQMSFMKSLAKPGVPNKYAWVLDVLEQLTICKYKGKPHWGKNHERSFKHPSCPIRDSMPLWDQMDAFQAHSDPNKIFQPKLFEEMTVRATNSYSPGCSVRGQCYCTDHSHCAKGFHCLPSLAFPEFKACRLPGLL